MRDQRFDASEAFGQRAKFHTAQKTPRLLQSIKLEGDHAAEAGHLLLGQVVAGMLRSPRIVNPLHLFLGA